MPRLLTLGILAAATIVCSASTVRPTISGNVVGPDGKPLPHTTVLIYHAGVKTGYSTYCPSCYVDCGKRVLTDSKGNFQIKDLAPDLWFELLAVKDGYVPQFAKKVDPAKTSSVALTLRIKPPITDFSGVVRGRVIDDQGQPIPNAVVNPVGVVTDDKGSSMYGTFPGLDPIAVTNKGGEFEIAYAKTTPKMLLNIEARAMAPKFVVMETGPERHSVALSEGATITGRLIANGKPVANAEIGVMPKTRGGFGMNLAVSGDPYNEIRIGTRPNGTFTIANVPEPVDWYVYPKMNSISQLGAANPVEVETTRDNQYIKAGDLLIQSGYLLKGTVILSDNKPIPDGMRIIISSDKVWDSQTTTLTSDGNFEFTNLPAGSYAISPSVKGYHIKGTRNRPFDLPVSIEHNVEDYTVTIYPGPYDPNNPDK
jgi:uncharacterized GH25 family protein